MKAVLKKSDASEPFTFSFVGKDGKTALKSENYKEKRSAVNGIESVKKNCTEDSRYELKESSNGKFFYNLKAANSQVIGSSMLYASEADRAAAIAELKKDAPKAEVDDQC